MKTPSEIDISIIPAEFQCVITGLIMWDPVITNTGQTYERHALKKWLKMAENGKKCPLTKLAIESFQANTELKANIEAFLSKHPEFKTPNYVGNPLYAEIAAAIEAKDAVKITELCLLLTNPADILVLDEKMQTSALHSLFCYGSNEQIKLLIDFVGPEIAKMAIMHFDPKHQWNAINIGARYNNVEAMSLALSLMSNEEAIESILHKDANGVNALLCSCRYGHLEVVRFLINTLGKEYAATELDATQVKVPNGLIFSLGRDNLDVTNLIIETLGQERARKCLREIPGGLSRVFDRGTPAILERLMDVLGTEATACITAPAQQGLNLLDTACINAKPRMVSVLLKTLGGNAQQVITQTHPERNNTLQIACLQSSAEVVKLLLKQLDNNTQLDFLLEEDRHGLNCLQIACCHNNVQNVGLILTALHNRAFEAIMHTNPDQWNALHFSADLADATAIGLLLRTLKTKAFAALQQKNKDGFTPLHFLCTNNKVACVELLINLFTEQQLTTLFLQTNLGNKTPIDLAILDKHVKLLTILKKRLCHIEGIAEELQKCKEAIDSHPRSMHTSIFSIFGDNVAFVDTSGDQQDIIDQIAQSLGGHLVAEAEDPTEAIASISHEQIDSDEDGCSQKSAKKK